MKVRDENYYQISGWMITRLKLKGAELQIFAIIYGFSQDGESVFSGSLSYLSEWLGVSRPTTIKTLKNLVDKNLIIKKPMTINGVVFNQYCVNMDVIGDFTTSKEALPPVKKFNGGSKETLLGGSKETLPNNNSIYNNINNNKKEINKEKSVKHCMGEYENVYLTDEELEKLKAEFPTDWTWRIENLSGYIASSGKKYKSHLATIRNWARKDKPKVQTSSQQRTVEDELARMLGGK